MVGQYIEPVLIARRQAPALPSLCAVCHGWGQQRVCAHCVDRFAIAIPRCRRCALDLPAGAGLCGACLADPPPYERTLAAVDYAYPWDGLIGRFKYQAALDLAPALVERLREAQRDAHDDPPDLLLPVPLSRERLRERGYNQAWEIARRLGAALRCPTDARLLLRVRNTPRQLALAPSMRVANVRGAFAVEPRRRAELAGREIAVIDDVMTTGATAAEVARVLLQAGAARVRVWVVARTRKPADR